jgi:ribosomal protein S18 acetylase RimI-like enzyme
VVIDPLFARVRAADAALALAAAAEVAPWRFGRAVFDAVYPMSYQNNRLLVEEALDGASFDELAAEAEALMGVRGLAHRRIDDLAPADDARLRDALEAAGWRREDDAWMAWRREPDGLPGPGVAHEVGWADLRPTIVRATAREPYATDPETLRQLVDRMERWQAAATVRHLAVPAPDGEGFAASCHLVLGPAPGSALIDEVSTLEEWRGRGFARAVVIAAVAAGRAAGADCVWLYADADDWPLELYRRLGFDVVGRTVTWTRWGLRSR